MGHWSHSAEKRGWVRFILRAVRTPERPVGRAEAHLGVRLSAYLWRAGEADAENGGAPGTHAGFGDGVRFCYFTFTLAAE